MRSPRTLAALVVLNLAFLAPARAQIETDLGAAAAEGHGVSASAGAAPIGMAGSPQPLLMPSLALSAQSLPPSLAPAVLPSEAAALPASALVAAPASIGPAASVPVGERSPAPKGPAAAGAAAPAGPGSDAASAPPSFALALRNLGVPDDLTARLVEFLATRHPGDQGSLYHGLGHSQEVAGYAARVAENADLPAARKVLLIFSAALHDVDPERAPGTPARAPATLTYLDGDPAASALVSEFGSRYGFGAAQVKALIMATDFSANPAERKAKQDAFESAARAAFPGEDFGLVWGRRLAFVDQASTYLADAETARRRVEGLAREIRSNLTALSLGATDAPAPAGASPLAVQGPSDAQMLAGTAKVLSALRQNPDFTVLPADLQRRFEDVRSYFASHQTPEAWAAASAPAPARAPPSPDLTAARKYVASIAGGIKLNERQTDALLHQFFEEEGIRPGSPRAEAVRAALLPSRVAAENQALSGLSPVLQRHRTVLLRLAAERGTTPAAIEAVLTRRGMLAISALGDAAFERQAGLTLDRDELERAVAAYPHNAQGEFMRGVAGNMATASGKSVEEVARDGVFAYVDFAGASVRSATSGRDPDVRATQAVMYVTRQGGRWRIGGYRQNRATGRRDAELVGIIKKWLSAGGLPSGDFE